jgi:hypothetical protein
MTTEIEVAAAHSKKRIGWGVMALALATPALMGSVLQRRCYHGPDNAAS